MAKPRTVRPWTGREQKALLRLVDAGHPDREIALELGRSRVAIRCKRQALGRSRWKRTRYTQVVYDLDRWVALPWLEARLAARATLAG